MKRSIKSLQLEHINHGIYHCTLNPNENDSVRIHLIPPKFKLFRNESYIVIINGYYLIPIGSSWAAILACYINEMHTFEGRSITEDDQHNIVDRVSDKICQIFRYVNKATVADHLDLIINVIFDIAYGKDPQIVINRVRPMSDFTEPAFSKPLPEEKPVGTLYLRLPSETDSVRLGTMNCFSKPISLVSM